MTERGLCARRPVGTGPHGYRCTYSTVEVANAALSGYSYCVM